MTTLIHWHRTNAFIQWRHHAISQLSPSLRNQAVLDIQFALVMTMATSKHGLQRLGSLCAVLRKRDFYTRSSSRTSITLLVNGRATLYLVCRVFPTLYSTRYGVLDGGFATLAESFFAHISRAADQAASCKIRASESNGHHRLLFSPATHLIPVYLFLDFLLRPTFSTPGVSPV